jgi:hypothetical protein
MLEQELGSGKYRAPAQGNVGNVAACLGDQGMVFDIVYFWAQLFMLFLHFEPQRLALHISMYLAQCIFPKSVSLVYANQRQVSTFDFKNLPRLGKTRQKVLM